MARKCESLFYHETRRALSSAIKSDRIESPMTANGFPDMILHFNSNGAFIENKAWCGNSKYFPEVRKSQLIWFREKIKVNCNCWVFAKITGTYCLYKGTTVKALFMAKRNKTEWVKLADYVWENKMNWNEFIDLIKLGEDNASS